MSELSYFIVRQNIDSSKVKLHLFINSDKTHAALTHDPLCSVCYSSDWTGSPDVWLHKAHIKIPHLYTGLNQGKLHSIISNFFPKCKIASAPFDDVQ